MKILPGATQVLSGHGSSVSRLCAVEVVEDSCCNHKQVQAHPVSPGTIMLHQNCCIQIGIPMPEYSLTFAEKLIEAATVVKDNLLSHLGDG